MTPNSTLDPQPVAEPQTGNFSYNHFGKRSAQDACSEPGQLDGAMNKVYEHFLREAHLDENGRRQRIAQLEAEVLQKKNETEKIGSELQQMTRVQAHAEERLYELKEDRVRIRSSEPDAPDSIAFAIGAFITLLLTGFVFLFYFSAGFAAIFGSTANGLLGGLFNPNVFSQAKSQGGAVIALLSLFPIIFLGLGFLVHDALEKKRFAVLSGLIAFTLLADGLIGYKITEARYVASHPDTPESWHGSMVFTEPDFYLVLTLGFAVYMIWGVLLHFVLSKYREMQPDRLTEVKLERNDQLINEQQLRLTEALNQISNAEGQRRVIHNDIAQAERDITGFRNGVIPVNMSRLRGIIAEFQQGWIAYNNLMLPDSRAHAVNATGTARIEQWLTAKIESLALPVAPLASAGTR